MQIVGLEPTPKYMDMNLNHARMPIPPYLHLFPVGSKMRKMGLEPTRHYCHKILSLARLPIPTLPHVFLPTKGILSQRESFVNDLF